MDDFLYILKLMLSGRLDDNEIQEQIELYENYIEEELASGKTTEQVMRKLGDPAKIADMIVEDYEKRKAKEPETEKKWKDMTAEDLNSQIRNPERGVHAEFRENEGWDVRIGRFKLNSWYGTLILLGIVLAASILINELKGLF